MLLKNKVGIIMGVANADSIAWGCATHTHREGAKLVLSYLDNRIKPRIEPLAETIHADVLELDVTNEQSVKLFFNHIKKEYGKVDFIIHSIAYANKEDLRGKYVNTSRDGFTLALQISAFSLVEMAKYAADVMKSGGSIITMSYMGSERVVESYNVMGVAKAALEASVRYLAKDLGPSNIRVNAISAGPINTLAARGIGGFTKVLHIVKDKAPLRRNVTIDDVGKTACFLASDYSSGITGEIIHVDAGFNIVAV
jgi:enoyl-[acyl-carrier protein] reductase I